MHTHQPEPDLLRAQAHTHESGHIEGEQLVDGGGQGFVLEIMALDIGPELFRLGIGRRAWFGGNVPRTKHRLGSSSGSLAGCEIDEGRGESGLTRGFGLRRGRFWRIRRGLRSGRRRIGHGLGRIRAAGYRWRLYARHVLADILERPDEHVEDQRHYDNRQHHRGCGQPGAQVLHKTAPPTAYTLTADFVGRTAHDGRIDVAHFFRVADEQTPVAQRIDHARHAPRELVDGAHGFLVKLHLAPPAGDMEPVGDVVQGFFLGKRLQVIPRGNTLVELAQVLEREHLAQLGLTDEDDLDQLLLLRLEVREEADLLENLRRKVLRFVDDKHAVLTPRRLLQQVLIQPLDQFKGVVALRVDPELAVDLLEQLDGVKRRVEDERDLGVLVELVEQIPADGSLAGADLAGKHDKPAPVLDPE